MEVLVAGSFVSEGLRSRKFGEAGACALGLR